MNLVMQNEDRAKIYVGRNGRKEFFSKADANGQHRFEHNCSRWRCEGRQECSEKAASVVNLKNEKQKINFSV
jgi:hypothetical protein